jgi:hypothetical protein
MRNAASGDPSEGAEMFAEIIVSVFSDPSSLEGMMLNAMEEVPKSWTE